MKTLKETWIDLINKILNSANSERISDYLELRNQKVKISLSSDFNELLKDKEIDYNYHEMYKVFFTTEDNIFGHSYNKLIQVPNRDITDPIDSIVSVLSKNETSRKAILSFISSHQCVPCLSLVQFLIRKNKLYINYYARSQEIITKFPCDAMCIAHYAKLVSAKLDIEIEEITGFIASAHIYIKDIDKAKKLCQTYKRKIIVTGNPAKYSCFENLLKSRGYSIKITNYNFKEIQSLSIEEAAKHKAKDAYNYFGKEVWVDDVYLITEAFTNFPGCYTKHLFKILDPETISMIFENKSHKAKIICTLCSYNGSEYSLVQGENKGILDFSKMILDQNMPLNSIFVCKDPLLHRRNAINKLITLD